jgi:DNA-binding IclR family transcriptional regulator
MCQSPRVASESATKPVPAVERFAEIMDALAQDSRPRGISELAREVGLPRSTVHSVCHTLAELGILDRLSSGEFTVGTSVLSWSAAFESQNNLSRVFASLGDPLPERVALNVSILSGPEVMYVGHREGADPLAVRFRDGLRFWAPHTATGKAILSTMPDEEVIALLGEHVWPQAPAPNSLGNVDDLLGDLAETRRRGYSLDNRELRPSLVSCGAPVFSGESGARAVAGVSTAMVAGRPPSDVEAAGEAIARFAAEFSRRLGASPRRGA